ncbi:MAG: glycosyltransferase family 2 protein [Candidatus Calescibacterium sp.]|nr:glycosyltransferase family 2 protein [Candidatus Calescibacterium sp.]MDW8132850.1 glycosyltransferase family 2 protein [Candidatus Calescibacterium sp.]
MILVICPVYNEYDKILDFIKSILGYVSKHVHFLFMEDNSDDLTKKICLFVNNSLPLSLKDKLLFIFNEFNLGYGENLFKGFYFALNRGYEYVLTIDCDFQHLPSYIPMFLNLSKKYDFITGSRYSFNSLTLSKKNFFRYLINKKMVDLIRIFYGKQISDFFCGFRLYKRNLLEYIYVNLLNYKLLNNVKFSYDFPIYLWVDILNFVDVIKEIPIPFIFFEERNFKGSNSELLVNHYERARIYMKIFIEYYNKRRR